MGERVLTVGGNGASRPISDFLQTNEYFGPKGGVYYVDGNVAATGGGSPDHPYSTLAEAITASDAAIALAANRWWARRNRIFACGDTLDETLVKFPTKCDIIGCGSYDANTKLGLQGNHASVGEAYGTRLINIHLKGEAIASAIITLTNSSGGLQLISCTLDATLGTITNGVLATAHPFLELIDCDFIGTFAAAYLTFGAGEAGRARILGNRMLGVAPIGIVIPNTTTASWVPLIQGNTIKATGLVIDDDSDLFAVVKNDLLTEANIGTTTDGYDFNLALASGNNLTGLNGIAATVPFAMTAEG